MDTRHDTKVLPRCRKLGHEITFRYCGTAEEGLPCGGIAGCWKNVFNIESFLADNYSNDELGNILNRKKSRMDIILEQLKKTRDGER
ncbi:MAG: hypothetical protein JW728_02210 [Candidatus Aureabacteria bacterium]|nr:hypothetical protein [Candidatus Auribacterota bacterium]